MNKNRFYQIIIATLLILNIVLLFLHFNRPERPVRPRNIIIERLHFDKNQIEQYEALIDKHHELIITNEVEINKVKDELYQQLIQPYDSLKVDSLSKNIADLQKNAEMINFKHFQDIKQICKSEQLPDFEKLVGELTQIFGKKNPPNRKNFN
jgi:periplasmic protein CpxP/Spy